jgi:hypothetical protein
LLCEAERRLSPIHARKKKSATRASVARAANTGGTKYGVTRGCIPGAPWPRPRWVGDVAQLARLSDAAPAYLRISLIMDCT